MLACRSACRFTAALRRDDAAKADGACESATDGPKRPRCKQKGNTAYESPEPIIIGVSHQIGHYADALRVPAGYEQIIPREHVTLSVKLASYR